MKKVISFSALALASVSFADVKLAKADLLYLDYTTGKLYHAKTGAPQGAGIPPAITNKDLEEVGGKITAETKSSVRVIVFNVNKNLAKVTVEGTVLSAPNLSGYDDLGKLIEALKGDGITSANIPKLDPPFAAANPTDEQKAARKAWQDKFDAIKKAIDNCSKVEGKAAQVQNFLVGITTQTTYKAPGAFDVTRWLPGDKDSDIAVFDSDKSAALDAISDVIDPKVRVFFRDSFNAKTDAARKVLVEGKKAEAKAAAYAKEPLGLFEDYFVCSPSEEVEVSGYRFQLDVNVDDKEKDADKIFLSKRYEISTTGEPASFFTSLMPFVGSRVVESRFFVDGNNTAQQEILSDRFGADNLAYAFNYQPGGSKLSFTFGLMHSWKDLKSISTNNVGLMFGLTYWFDNAWGLAGGYVDTPIRVLAANGPVTSVDDIQTKYRHPGAFFLGLSFKTGGGGGGKKEEKK